MFGGNESFAVEKYPDNFEEYTSPNDTLLPKEYQNYKGIISHYRLDGSAALLVNTDVFAELGLNPDDFTSYEDSLWPELKGHIAMGDPANSLQCMGRAHEYAAGYGNSSANMMRTHGRSSKNL